MNIFNTTTTIGALGAPLATTSSTLNEDGSVNKNNLLSVLVPVVSSTATVGMGYVMNQHDLKRIKQDAATSYIESMSDEELISALEQLDMLDSEINNKNDNKTI